MYKILGADQREYGPVTADQVRQWLTEHRLNGQSLARLEGTEGWKALSQFPEFAAALATATPAPSPMVPPDTSTAPAPTNNMAITGLVMGSLSMVCCQVLGILGIIFSAMALSQIKSNPAQKGKGLAIAGLILSIVSLVFLAVLLAFGAFANLIQQFSR